MARLLTGSNHKGRHPRRKLTRRKKRPVAARKKRKRKVNAVDHPHGGTESDRGFVPTFVKTSLE